MASGHGPMNSPVSAVNSPSSVMAGGSYVVSIFILCSFLRFLRCGVYRSGAVGDGPPALGLVAQPDAGLGGEVAQLGDGRGRICGVDLHPVFLSSRPAVWCVQVRRGPRWATRARLRR